MTPPSADRPLAGPSSQTVRRRRTFYIPGFDPRGPGAYHAIYQREAVLQGKLTGATYRVGSRKARPGGTVAWNIEAWTGEDLVNTDYRLFRWDDAVRSRWRRSLFQLFGDTFRSVVVFLRGGALELLRLGAPAPFFAVIFSSLCVSLFLLAATIIVGAMIWAGQRLGAPLVGLLLSAGFVALLPRFWRRLDQLIGICWLTRCFHYMADSAQGIGLGDSRWRDLAAQVAEAALDDTLDEVLVTAHSQGTVHAIRVMAMILRGEVGPARFKRPISLLTLGQPFALYRMAPDDAAFRDDLALVATSPGVVWMDVTSPADPPSSGGVDPLWRTPLPAPGLWPVTRSPRFHTLVTARTLRRLRLNALRYHFQYIMAGEIAGAYDYFRLTAGPCRLLQDERGAPGP